MELMLMGAAGLLLLLALISGIVMLYVRSTTARQSQVTTPAPDEVGAPLPPEAGAPLPPGPGHAWVARGCGPDVTD